MTTIAVLQILCVLDVMYTDNTYFCCLHITIKSCGYHTKIDADGRRFKCFLFTDSYIPLYDFIASRAISV